MLEALGQDKLEGVQCTGRAQHRHVKRAKVSADKALLLNASTDCKLCQTSTLLHTCDMYMF